MSPGGELIAYSMPANIKQIRDQAALASTALKDAHTAPRQPIGLEIKRSDNRIDRLTINSERSNLVIQYVQPGLYIALLAQSTTPELAEAQERGLVDDVPAPSNHLDNSHVNTILDAKDKGAFDQHLLNAQCMKLDAIVRHVQSEVIS